jgi:predicted transposase YdaD
LRLNAPALLPFVPAMRGGGTVAAVRQALEQLRDSVQLQQDERLKDAALALVSFARYSLTSEALEQLVRWINMMNIVQDSPLYQDIIQRGIQQGMQQGRAEELQNVLVRLLTRRVGPLDEEARRAVVELSFERAEKLAEDLLDFAGPEDLARWLADTTIN